MTTPDKEEMPTEDRTAGPWRLSLVSDAITQEIWSDTVRPELFATCRGQRARANAAFIVTACNAYEPMREALNLSRDALEQARLYIEGDEETHGRQFGDGNAVRSALAKIDSALSTLPVNDRHHSGSDSYQADAGAPALSEKVNVRSEWLPIESAPKDGRSILIGGGSYSYSGETFPEDRPFEQVAKAAYVDGEWFGGFGSEYDEKYSHSPTHWMPLPSPPGAEVTISNDAERDGGENA